MPEEPTPSRPTVTEDGVGGGVPDGCAARVCVLCVCDTRGGGGGGGVGTRPRYPIVCLWRRPLASRHCSF